MKRQWADEEDEILDEEEESKNPYLTHPENGLALVRKLLDRNSSGAQTAG